MNIKRKIRNRIFRTGRRQNGSAALEVLLLIPFILLIWMLLVNMGYNGVRHRMTQAALRIAAFQFVAGMSEMNRQQAEQAAASTANQNMFPGEGSPATFSFSKKSVDPGVAASTSSSETGGLLAKASSRETVGISVSRTPPYGDVFPRTPLKGGLIVASNTWTYCEMKDDDLGVPVMSQIEKTAKFGLWLFGGCGGTKLFKCEDRCP